jgi:hypothetical protein
MQKQKQKRRIRRRIMNEAYKKTGAGECRLLLLCIVGLFCIHR